MTGNNFDGTDWNQLLLLLKEIFNQTSTNAKINLIKCHEFTLSDWFIQAMIHH